MRQIPLAGIDPDTLRPLSPQQVARRAQIAACMRLAAEAAREGRKAVAEIAVACAVAAPAAATYVICLMPS